MNLNELVTAIGDGLEFRLFEVGGTVITGASVATFFVVILASFWISRVIQKIAVGLMHRSGLAHEGTVATTRRLLHYAVMIVGVAVALQSIGISLATVFAAGAVAAVAIGFALQNILQNFVSGLILLGERSIKETDVLEVEGSTVRVIRMGARATVARTREEEELIIPNSTLVQSTVKNLTLTDQVYRVRTRVGVSYSSDMHKVEEVLTATAARLENREPSRDPVVFMIEFGDSSVVWETSVWAADPWRAPLTRSDLNKAVWWALKDAGITIAFPQVDVHFDPGSFPSPDEAVSGAGSPR
jgi:potassium efflux system protein